MKKIFKYLLGFGPSTISLPIGAKILAAQLQAGDLVLWALIDESEQVREDRFFCVYLTGQPIIL
jgi:hypothetical protein